MWSFLLSLIKPNISIFTSLYQHFGPEWGVSIFDHIYHCNICQSLETARWVPMVTWNLLSASIAMQSRCLLCFRAVWQFYDDVIKWKHFPRYWPFVRGIHRSSVNSPHKGQWRGTLMFSLICVWINDWVNNREAGDMRRYRAHYDVILMLCPNSTISGLWKHTIWLLIVHCCDPLLSIAVYQNNS